MKRNRKNTCLSSFFIKLSTPNKWLTGNKVKFKAANNHDEFCDFWARPTPASVRRKLPGVEPLSDCLLVDGAIIIPAKSLYSLSLTYKMVVDLVLAAQFSFDSPDTDLVFNND
ncbi:MAG: hypothetical protein LBK53_04465 [Heliobacteriaceae bacterium]|jgi:hypothetical protein|nr:hypothetical protein [Heliobacteriaceae bacterium]